MRDLCLDTVAHNAGTSAEGATAPHLQGWAALLERFYLRANRDLPRLQQLHGDNVPEPYKTLLVHSSDMTPTLERYFGQELGLTVLSREREGHSYLREVVLTLGPERSRILYGAIRIFMNHLPLRVSERVLQEQYPLGRILQTEALPHLSWPQAFFRAQTDSHMSALLGTRGSCSLYGRRNVLLDGSRRLLAEVIEVLAPVNRKPASGDARGNATW